MGVQANLLVLATAQTTVMSFIDVFIGVYTLLILAYIVLTLVPPGSIAGLGGARRFLDDVCTPYLAIFRRFVPPLGPLDLSPMIAVIGLILIDRILDAVVVRLL
jgi:YggT family protein